MMLDLLARLTLIVAFAAALSSFAHADDAAGLDLFEKKVRPVLVRECYQCHSAAAAAKNKLKGGLLLDSREGSLKGGESGPAVVPGKPGESLLISAIKHEDFEMPPKGKLPDAVIADIVKWIELGAPDPRSGSAVAAGRQIDIAAGRQFWSLKRFEPVAPPDVADGDWTRTPVDRFIRAKQESLGIKPNGPASARVLIRRAYFDLLGLPPSPQEMQEWTARLTGGGGGESLANAAAYAELIDHLLASGHYGERWARHWLDVARFAESHGYEQDYDRPNAYHYRDFLIRAFNADMPYDQFVRWQLAGDELAPNDPLAWMATGFLAAGAFPTQLTEAEFESARYDELDDMVATTGVAFLGFSVGCARCHDHKFDPIRSDDYYRLASSFTTTIRSEIEVDLQPHENARRQAEYQANLAAAGEKIARYEREMLPDQFAAWLATFNPETEKLSTWEVLEGEITSSAGSRFERQADGSYLARGAAPPQEVITFTAESRRTGIAAFRLEALADNSLPQKGPGRAPNGNFALGDFQVIAQNTAGSPPVAAKLVAAKATHQQNESSLSVAASIDADPISGWAVDGQIGRDQAAVFVAQEPTGFEAGTRLTFKLTFNHPNARHAIGRLRISVTRQAEVPPAVGNSGPDAKVVDALLRLKQSGATDGPDWQTALAWYKTTLADWRQLEKGLADLKQAGPGLQLSKVLVASEGLPHLPHHADDRGFPHFYPETYFLRRGDVNQKGDVATPGFLPVLLPADDDGSRWAAPPSIAGLSTGDAAHAIAPAAHQPTYRRTRLANWLTDVEHGAGHLAARVIVNRLWQHHFGRGLVATPNDFGASGEAPSHPELLDWLAQDLVAHGWQLKRLHKLLMTSAVYLESAEYDAAREKLDRENTSYWRHAARRLEAEAIRDAMLSVSGRLDPTMYGPGTLDQNMRRRGVYFFIKRSQLIPMMMLFDWPEHLVSIGQRTSTTIAPQALLFMNSPQGRGYAEGFSGRLAELDDQRFLSDAYSIAFGRQPSEKELALAAEFLRKQTADYTAAGKGDAARLARVDFCQTLMSMNEFVYVE